MSKWMMTTLAVGVALACWAPSIEAQQRSIVLENSNPPVEIPIRNTPARFNNRVMTVECVKNAQGNCAISGGGAPATVSFTCPSCSSARVGQAVSLSWSSQRAEACLAGSTGPAATSWTGAQATSAVARSLLFTAAGSYSLTMKCYGAGPASSLQTIAVSVAP